MARPQPDDDRDAILRRLERIGTSPQVDADDQSQASRIRPALSARAVLTVLTIFALLTIALWAPWEDRTSITVPAIDSKVSTQTENLNESLPEKTTTEVASEPQEIAPEPPVSSKPDTESFTEPIIVNVVGHVKEPGVIEIPADSRVIDAIEAAGGATSKADLSRLNLARRLVDEEYIAVLSSDEEPPTTLPPVAGASVLNDSTNAPQPPSQPANKQETGDAVLNLNTATEAELMTLPGVGPVLAERIMAWRAQHGGFRTIDELREVSGVGPKIFAQLAPLVSV